MKWFLLLFVIIVLTDQGLSREFLAKCISILVFGDLETMMSLSFGGMCVLTGFKLTSAFQFDFFLL